MDSTSLASTMVAQQAERTQTSIAAAMLKMNARADQGIVDLLQTATAATKAAAAPGTGTVLDIQA